MAGPSAAHALLEDDDWGSAAVEWELLLEEVLGIASGQTVEPVANASEATSLPGQDPHRSGQWCHVPPPLPELEILSGGVSPTEVIEQVLVWGSSGMATIW